VRDVNEVSILLPRVSASTIVTHLIVRSGETAVLGGLLTRTDADVERGIPGLKEIPLLKWLFTVKEKQKTMQNLIVFMTPRIIRNSEDIEISIKETVRQSRALMNKEWEDMFPEDVKAEENATAPAKDADKGGHEDRKDDS